MFLNKKKGCRMVELQPKVRFQKFLIARHDDLTYWFDTKTLKRMAI